jgi:large subunit ribosomal protein L31
MKKDIHPKYEHVVYRCPSTGTEILTRSTKLDGPTMEYKGRKVPTVSIEICSDNHPFYTGKSGLVDTAGRVDAFNKRFARTRATKKA